MRVKFIFLSCAQIVWNISHGQCKVENPKRPMLHIKV